MSPRILPFLCAAVVGCGSRGEVVVIGAAGPWKEGYGLLNKRGIELAVQEINSAKGVDGRRLEVVMRDDNGDGERAAGIAQEFVGDNRIVAVVGHVNSGAMLAASRVYDGNLVALSTTASSPDLTGISPWVFRVISSDSTNGLDLARFAVKLGHRRASIMYENDAYGRGLAESFKRNFTGALVSVDPIGSSGDQDFEPFVSYFKRHNPDVVFVAGTEASGMAILREAKRQKLDAAFLGGDGWTGIVADSAAAQGAYVGAPFSPDDSRPEAQRFVAAYKAKFRGVPDGNAALAYDATMLIAKAIEKSGTKRKRIRDFLAALDEVDAYSGVTGQIRFHASGDPVGKEFVMTRVRDGAMVLERRQ